MRWLLLSLVMAFGTACPALAVAQSSAVTGLSYAEKTFVEGQRLFFEKRYQEALPLFEQSFSLQSSPNSRLYIARCYAELGELLRAYDEYRDVIVQVSETDDPAHYAPTQLAASEERAALKKRLSIVRIHLSDQPRGLRLFIDDREVTQQSATADHLADPGHVTLKTTAPGRPDFEHSFDAPPGEVTDVAVLLGVSRTVYYPALVQPPPVVPPPASHPAEDWAWASAGVGVLGLATWGIFAVQAERRFYRIQPDCSAGACPADQVERGRTETLVANVGLGVGLAGLAGAGALWVWSKSEQEQPPPARHAEQKDSEDKASREEGAPGSAVEPDVALGFSPRGVHLFGTF